MTYDTRYCAFADILNFRGLINQLRDETLSVEELKVTLSSVHRPPFTENKVLPIFRDSELKRQSISDGVCLSTAFNHDGLHHLLSALEWLSIALLQKGYFVRGGVVRGKLYHDDTMVFGDALVKAYELESTVARYPRIMLSREVADDAKALGETTLEDDLVNDFVRQSDDGPYHLHVLQGMEVVFKSLEDVEERRPHLERYNLIASQIQRRLDDATDNPRHFEKVQWFAQYWNVTVLSLTGGPVGIQGPGVAPVLAVSQR